MDGQGVKRTFDHQGKRIESWNVDKMKHLATISLIICAALLVGITILDHQQLPEKIASHFNGSGTPNGWMSRSSFTLSMVAIGLGIPFFAIAIMYLIRFFPAKFLNIPHPAYWRDPKNYRKACDFLFMSSLWFGCSFIIWQIFFSRLIVGANRISPPHLDSGKVILLTIPLLVFTFAWIVVLLMRFFKIDNK